MFFLITEDWSKSLFFQTERAFLNLRGSCHSAITAPRNKSYMEKHLCVFIFFYFWDFNVITSLFFLQPFRALY